jgi:AraC family transcriptional regulator
MSTYVRRRRAFRALAEVMNTDHSLAEIARHCGFYDQAHFAKVFTTLFGVTPGRLRSRTS